jgi:hypothetical protein
LSLNGHFLLQRRELDHAPAFLRVVKRSENLSSHSKVRMVHMGLLASLREAKSKPPKLLGSHGQSPIAEYKDDSTVPGGKKGLDSGLDILYILF